MAKKEKEICPYCGKGFVYLNRHKCPKAPNVKEDTTEDSLINKIEFKVSKLPSLDIKAKIYDVIISKDLLHHIPDPDNFWKEIERLANDATSIFVMDLIRPGSEKDARKIVESVSPDEPEILKLDFYNSLLAAFTINEIKEQIERTNLVYQIDKLGDRHFIAKCKIK